MPWSGMRPRPSSLMSVGAMQALRDVQLPGKGSACTVFLPVTPAWQNVVSEVCMEPPSTNLIPQHMKRSVKKLACLGPPVVHHCRRHCSYHYQLVPVSSGGWSDLPGHLPDNPDFGAAPRQLHKDCLLRAASPHPDHHFHQLVLYPGECIATWAALPLTAVLS